MCSLVLVAIYVALILITLVIPRLLRERVAIWLGLLRGTLCGLYLRSYWSTDAWVLRLLIVTLLSFSIVSVAISLLKVDNLSIYNKQDFLKRLFTSEDFIGYTESDYRIAINTFNTHVRERYSELSWLSRKLLGSDFEVDSVIVADADLDIWLDRIRNKVR